MDWKILSLRIKFPDNGNEEMYVIDYNLIPVNYQMVYVAVAMLVTNTIASLGVIVVRYTVPAWLVLSYPIVPPCLDAIRCTIRSRSDIKGGRDILLGPQGSRPPARKIHHKSLHVCLAVS